LPGSTTKRAAKITFFKVGFMDFITVRNDAGQKRQTVTAVFIFRLSPKKKSPPKLKVELLREVILTSLPVIKKIQHRDFRFICHVIRHVMERTTP